MLEDLSSGSDSLVSVTVGTCTGCSDEYEWDKSVESHSDFDFEILPRTQFVRTMRIYDYAKSVDAMNQMIQTSGCLADSYGNSCTQCDIITGVCFDNADFNTYTDDHINNVENTDLIGIFEPSGYLLNTTTGDWFEEGFTPFDSDGYFWIEKCGDGKKMGFQEWDDGNNDSGDGCNNKCIIEDDTLWDGGDENSPDVCIKLCSNSVISTSEECDDGNTDNSDGCSDSCEIEDGYTCTTDNPSDCTEICGDVYYFSSSSLAWDDGNTVDGDGCSADCMTVETGYVCSNTNTDAQTCSSIWGDSLVASDESCDNGHQ